MQSLGSALTPEEMQTIRTDEPGSCVCTFYTYDGGSSMETIEGEFWTNEECDDECFSYCGSDINCMTATGHLIHGSGSGSDSDSVLNI